MTLVAQTQQTQTRARIFLFLRPRPLLMLGALLLMAGGASAQLPSVPEAGYDLATPFAAASAHAQDGRICATGDIAALPALDSLPAALPAVPALPVPALPAVPAIPAAPDLPAALPTVPDVAPVDADACIADGASISVRTAQGHVTADADATGGSAQAETGFLSAALAWFLNLF